MTVPSEVNEKQAVILSGVPGVGDPDEAKDR